MKILDIKIGIFFSHGGNYYPNDLLLTISKKDFQIIFPSCSSKSLFYWVWKHNNINGQGQDIAITYDDQT